MQVIFLAYALGHLGLFVASVVRLLGSRTLASIPLILVTAGLVCDNAMIALGSAVGAGEQLQNLSVPRYFMHAVSTPLLVLSALGLVRRSGAGWSRGSVISAIAAVVVVALVAFGFWSDMLNLELELSTDDGLVTYSNVNSVPVAPIAVIVLIVAAGVVIWRHGGGPWLLLGALAQVAATVTGDMLAFAGNLGELALLAGFVVTDWRLRRPARP